MELLGMAAGSVLIGNVADRIGRRPTILGCLLLIACGMFAAAHAPGVTRLSAPSFLTGLGIGRMLSSPTAMVTEFSHHKHRGLNLALHSPPFSHGPTPAALFASRL